MSDLLFGDANQWQVGQVLVLDWYDGPREGLCSLSEPAGDFYFELFAERYSEDDLDDRLFSVSEVPKGALNQLLSSLSALGEPKRPVWVPTWQFESEAERLLIDKQIENLLAQSKRTNLIIQTKDMVNIQDYWQRI